jgi:SNF2 family DNA or RNA helicase
MHKFYPHQERALAYATPRSRIFLAMEMRTGKSAVTIRWAKARRLKKVLIIAPLSTINPGWVEELEKEGIPERRIHILSEIKKSDRLSVLRVLPGWHLINYEYVRTNPEILDILGDGDDCGIVLDECTRIRSPKAQISKVLLRETKTEHRALLSGLPNPESVMNWFNQIVFQNGEFLGTDNYWKFRGQNFYQPRWSAWDWKPKKGAMEKIKNEVHAHVFVLTAKQAGMGSKHVYEKRVVEMNMRQRKLTTTILKDFEYEGMETKWAPVQQTWLARIAGGFSPDGTENISNAKQKEVLSILKNDLPKNAQIVVWARFRSEIHSLTRFLKKNKIATVAMTGGTDRLKRRRLIKGFQQGKYRVIVVQEKLGMYGLNLAVADTDIYYSNLWENEVRSQCEKRIEHLTKKRPLLHIDLITRDSVDEEVVPRLREKKLKAKHFNLVVNKTIARWRRVHPLDIAA